MKNLLSENMLRFGTKNLSEAAQRELVLKSIMETINQHGLYNEIRSRLTEGVDPNSYAVAASAYFSNILSKRPLVPGQDEFQKGTVLYRVTEWVPTRQFYKIAFWGIVMKPHPKKPATTANNAPLFFTAQGVDLFLMAYNGEEQGLTDQRPSPQPARNDLDIQNLPKEWNAQLGHWTRPLVQGDLNFLVPSRNMGPNGEEHFKNMVNALPDYNKLMKPFCADATNNMKLVYEPQRELYRCPA